jgi:hypothetical protein
VGIVGLVLFVIGAGLVLVGLGVVARWDVAGAADALLVAPRVRTLFQEVLSCEGRVSGPEFIATGRDVERDLLALERRVLDRRLRRHIHLVMQDVVAVATDVPAAWAATPIKDLYRRSAGADRARAALLCDEADRGMRAVGDLEARAVFLARLGKMVGR